ncbi:hypothetical protein [Corynebacterium stationis]|uniref:Uncharacterized protein n=1 Tax=Corynebacterium stationis TaxID=1705 RepID=A0AB36CLQ0_9CORY|nr:hypothetical protein [Corynebacterium stationis]NME89584.1 hypothetical protein [Corynebacterium stationis]
MLTKLVNVGFEFDEQAIIDKLGVLVFGEFLPGAPLFEQVDYEFTGHRLPLS